MREQNSGAKVLLRNIFFRQKSLVQTRELCSGSRVAGACCGSKLPRVCRPLPLGETTNNLSSRVSTPTQLLFYIISCLMYFLPCLNNDDDDDDDDDELFV